MIWYNLKRGTWNHLVQRKIPWVDPEGGGWTEETAGLASQSDRRNSADRGPWSAWPEQGRIQLLAADQCCGSGMFIPDPWSGMFIPDPWSWFLSILDPRSNNSTKRGVEFFLVLPFFVATAHKYHKIVNNFIFEQAKKYFYPKHKKL